MAQEHILKVSRLESLSDGIFAIAMTILILNLSIPPETDIGDIMSFLRTDILLKLFVYIGSFIILGTLWIGMHFQMGMLDHINRPYLWTHVFYLMIVCIVPFSASLIAAHFHHVIALSFFAINLLCASLMQLIIFQFAYYYKLNRKIYNQEMRFAVIRRVILAPIFYTAALIVAHWHTQIAFVLLIIPIMFYIRPGRIDRYDVI
ncbi:MAG TPA: TMEM175 family protein [Gammaproteobacteria bacterium]|jgi:uncharacterized membrane protein|nr:TMEM175 family protein [Gammaproteobacteria bacterium]